MKIEYTADKETALRNGFEVLKARKKSAWEEFGDRSRKPILIIAAVCWVVTILGQYLIEGISLAEATPIIALWFIIITPALFLTLYIVVNIPRYLVRLGVNRLPANHWGKRTAIIAPEGITIKSERKETKVERAEISDFIQTPNAIVAYGVKKPLLILPKDHFQLEEVLEALEWSNQSR